jgi:hypothetical protein
MEPLTWAVLLTLVATKATEKIGERIGEGVSDRALTSAKQLSDMLRKKSPDTLRRLEAAGELGDGSAIDVEIIEEVKQVAAAEPEMWAAVEATTAVMAAEPALSQQALAKLAEKIGVVNLGTVQNQTNNITI